MNLATSSIRTAERNLETASSASLRDSISASNWSGCRPKPNHRGSDTSSVVKVSEARFIEWTESSTWERRRTKQT